MKSLFILLFLVLLVCAKFVECEVFLEETSVKEGTKRYDKGFRCHSKQFGFMRPSQEKSLHKKNLCATASCAENGLITYLGCGSVGAGPGCRVIETNLSKPHPHCCPSVECKTQ